MHPLERPVAAHRLLHFTARWAPQPLPGKRVVMAAPQSPWFGSLVPLVGWQVPPLHVLGSASRIPITGGFLALATCLIPGTSSNAALQCFEISSDIMSPSNWSCFAGQINN